LVSWRGGVVLLLVLVGLGVFAYVTRSRPAPAASAVDFMRCPSVDTVEVGIQAPGKVVELQRTTPTDPWRVTRPVVAPGDQDAISYLVSSVTSIRTLNTIPAPRAPATYGLAPAREILTCRVNDGVSYTLSIGNQSFDGSGWYAQRSGDSRVYVISGVEVDAFDRALAKPPVKPGPSPTT
jgi:hypothetical protein